MMRAPVQVWTVRTTVRAIIRSPSFQRGVAEVRAGRLPRFDTENDWDYERGRQWAVVAPRSMPLLIGSKVNPKAVLIFKRNNIR
jgi:hypothetical protein